MNSIKIKPAGRIAAAFDPDPVDAFVGRRIAACREKAGYSADQVATALGISAGDFKCYEQGFLTAPEEVLYALSKLVRVSVRYLFDNDTAGAAV